MNGQEQTISSLKNWITPCLTILIRQGEQENVLTSCKMSSTKGAGLDDNGCTDLNNICYNKSDS